MQFITIAIVTALAGASPVPRRPANKGGLSWSISANTGQGRNGLKAAQDSEAPADENDEGPLGIASNLMIFEAGKDKPTAQLCYKDCGDDDSDGNDTGDDDSDGNDAGDDDSDGDDGQIGDDSDSDSDSDDDSYPASNEGYSAKAYYKVDRKGDYRAKGYNSKVGAGGDSRGKVGDSYSDSDSDDDKYPGLNGDNGYKAKAYSKVGGKGDSHASAYKPYEGAGGDSSSDSSSESNSDSDVDGNSESRGIGYDYNGAKADKKVGGSGNSRASAYKPHAGASGDSSSESDSDSDVEGNADSRGKGSGYNGAKAYNKVDGSGKTRTSAYKPYAGAGGDSSSESDSDSDVEGNADSLGKGSDYNGAKAYNKVDRSGKTRTSAYKTYSGAGGDSSSGSSSESDSDSDVEGDADSLGKGSDYNGAKAYNKVGGSGDSHVSAYKPYRGAGGDSYNKGDDSSSDSDSDSDSDDDKSPGLNGDNGYKAKAYSKVGGKGDSHASAYKPYEGADGDSSSDTGSDSDADGNGDSHGKGASYNYNY